MSRMAMLVGMMTAVQGNMPTPDPITVAREALRVTTPRCRYTTGDDIVVCARRNSDRYRLPIATAGIDREIAQRGSLLARETPCQARGPFLVGCGSVGVSVGVAFGSGAGSGAITYRPGMD